jgi:farnesyl-diphosphate farnesyltransferase
MTVNHRELLRSASRTFALSIERLPGVVGDSLCLAYLLLRVSDYLEDNDRMPAETKVELLELWDRILADEVPAARLVAALSPYPPGDDPDARVAHHAVEILEKVHALPLAVQTQVLVHVRNSTCGMARWVARGPDIPLEDDMDDYMHEVAGRVGYLVTDIFAWYSSFIRARLSQLMPLAREFGLALQTVNIIRGLRKDYERGWILQRPVQAGVPDPGAAGGGYGGRQGRASPAEGPGLRRGAAAVAAHPAAGLHLAAAVCRAHPGAQPPKR